MTDQPYFSIVLPTFNRPKLLQKAIESVQNQEFADWELIIVDDGTKESDRLNIKDLDSNKMVYFFQDNKGKASARNKGLELTRGKYICFLDDDDSYFPNHLRLFYEATKKNKSIKIFKSGIISFEKDKAIYQSPFLNERDLNSRVHFVLTNYFGLLDLCIESGLAKKHHFSDYPLWQDKFYLIPIVQSQEIYQIEKRTVRVNEHAQRSVNQAYKKPTVIAAQIKSVEDAFKKFKLEEHQKFGGEAKDKIIHDLLATHFYHALKYEGIKKAWGYATQYLKMRPSLLLAGTLLKYQISSIFK